MLPYALIFTKIPVTASLKHLDAGKCKESSKRRMVTGTDVKPLTGLIFGLD